MKKLHLLVAVAGLAAASVTAYWYQHRDVRPERSASSAVAPVGGDPSASGPAPVEVGKVETMTLADDAHSVGSLIARQSVMIRPEVSGRVAKLGFADGSRVQRGQLLVQLDDTLQRAQLQQAKAQSSIAATQLKRSRELLTQNFVSQSAVDQNASTLEVARAQVALAEAQLARMRIVAPFDGIAGIRAVNVGDYLKDGADVVMLEDTKAMYVDFRLPERFLARLQPAQAVQVSLDAIPGRTFEGQVEAVDSQLDANGRSLLVRARLDNPQGELRTGMFARVRTVFATRENALVVPEEALVPQGGKQYLVKVVDGRDGAPHSVRIEARIGARLPGKVEILDGVAAGDSVVTAGQARLMRADGLPLRVIDATRQGPAAGTSPGPARPAPAGAGGPPLRGATPA